MVGRREHDLGVPEVRTARCTDFLVGPRLINNPVDSIVCVVAATDARFVASLGLEAASHVHDGQDVTPADQ
jgi:hypothetical protein